MAIDYEAEGTPVSEDQLTRLGKLAKRQIELEEKILNLEKELKVVQEQHRRVSEIDIPSVLDESGLSEVRLSDGTKIVVKEDVRVSTTGKNRDAINSWLEHRGLDDIIRDEVTAAFKKGDHSLAVDSMRLLKEAGASAVDNKRYVNPQTFAALVRELLSEGESVPLDELGVFIQRRAKLERR